MFGLYVLVYVCICCTKKTNVKKDKHGAQWSRTLVYRHQRLWVRAGGSVAAGRDRKVHGATHNWPSVVRVRESLAGISLSHRALATPVAGRAQCMLTRSPGALCFLQHISAAGLMRAVLKKQCGLVGLCFGGRMAFDLRLSRARTGVVAMRQDSNY